MKTESKLILGVVMFIAMGLFTKCAKDGETGPTGANGTNGVNGTSGVNGNDGNANVHNYTFSLNISEFTGPVANGAYSNPYNPSSVMGSDYISENDVILLYLFDHTTVSTDYYNALPFLDYFNTGAAFNQHSFELGATGSTNILIINIRNSTGGAPYANMTAGTLSYKMVWIEGMGKSSSLDGVDTKDYYAVCEALNLEP